MRRFIEDKYSGRRGGGYKSGGRSSGGRDRGRSDGSSTTMYPAVCDECGRECKVPFRPSGDKPIYCSDCFEKRGNSHDGDSHRRSNRGSSDNLSSKQLQEINEKLDRILLALEIREL